MIRIARIFFVFSLLFLSVSSPAAVFSGRAVQEAQQAIETHFWYPKALRYLSSSSTSISPFTKELLAATGYQFKSSFRHDPNSKFLQNYPNVEVAYSVKRGLQMLRIELQSIAPTKQRENLLFQQALKKYEVALSEKNYPGDEETDPLLRSAFSDLLVLLKTTKNSEMRPFVLYLLGDIGSYLWAENKDRIGTVCFMEVIRTQPGSSLAKMAWVRLSEQIHFGYTGSSGNHTPTSWKLVLRDLKAIALGVAEEESPTSLSTAP